MTPGTHHWLVRVARQATLPGADALQLSADLAIKEAWREVARACDLDDPALAQVVARAFRMPVADLHAATPTAAKLLPASVARKHLVFPLADQERYLVVATADPTDPGAESTVGFASGRTPVLHIAPPETIERAIDATYRLDGAVESLLALVAEGDVDLVLDAPAIEQVHAEEVSSPPIVRLANAVLFEAIRERASDVHLQPTPTGGVVRNRVDGVLRTSMQMPLPVMSRVISRIKVLSGLDIADRVRPQDGRMGISVLERVYDLRISTVPTREAEKCVIRILDPQASRSLEEIGLPPHELALFRKQLNRRDGIVVVTGPTGSGKTTTLYGALREISTEAINVMTVEDPVEYELPGLTQIPVEPRRGVTFASALRALLRQDPDVIFVGEIRDSETAGIAVQASLTGHLVLATLHTNDALGAVRRLADLGVDLPAVTQTLRASLAQRLMRRVCPFCPERVDDRLTAAEEDLASEYGVRPVVRARGCERCSHTGYRGRMPVVEVALMTPELERRILENAPFSALVTAAREGGMRTLREGAVARVRAGDSTLEELDRVIGEDAEPSEGTDDTPRPPGEEAAGPTPGAPQAEEPTLSILVADDDRSTRMISRALLERAGYQVDEAPDGVAALEKLRTDGPYDVLVLDLEMPRAGGRDVLQEVRTTPALAGLVVVVLTGSEGEETEIELLERGADDYLRKPLDPVRFLTRIKAVVRRAQG